MPDDRARALAASQDAVVPCTVVDLFELVLTSVADPDTTGATAEMSGASCLSSRPATSFIVKVFAEPAPPRTPKLTSNT